MNNFIIGTFYTKDTPYKQVYEEYFLNSISQIKPSLTHFVREIESKGSWHLNTSYKPELLLDCMNTYKNMYDSIILLDADATINEYPKLFDEIPKEYDMACHFLDHDTWYRNGNHKKELLSGTLFFRINERVIKMINEWRLEVQKSNEWEQKVLQKVLSTYHDIKVYELPIEYCYINTLPNGQKPLVKVERPVISHNQVSRKLKKYIQLMKYNIKGVSNK